MATRVCLAFVVLLLGACGAGSQGAPPPAPPPPPGAGSDVQRPEPPAPPGPAQAAAVCPAQGEALAVAGATMPALEELARFPVLGGPTFVAHEEAVYWVTYDSRGGPPGGGPTTIEGYRLVLGQTTPRLLWRQERPGSRSMFGKLWASGSDWCGWSSFPPSRPPTGRSTTCPWRADRPPWFARASGPRTSMAGCARWAPTTGPCTSRSSRRWASARCRASAAR